MGMFDDLAVKEEVEISPFDALSTKPDEVESDEGIFYIENPLEALLTAALLMVYASSEKAKTLSDLEEFHIMTGDDITEYKINKSHYIHSLRHFHSWDSSSADSSSWMIGALEAPRLNIYRKSIRVELIPSIAVALNPRQHLIAIANLCDIAMLDGVLTGAEKELLMLFNEEFEIDPSELNKIIEATSLKNDIKEFGGLD